MLQKITVQFELIETIIDFVMFFSVNTFKDLFLWMSLKFFSTIFKQLKTHLLYIVTFINCKSIPHSSFTSLFLQ